MYLPGASNKNEHNRSHNAREEFDKTKKRKPKAMLLKYIGLFKEGYNCKPRNVKRGSELERGEDTGDILRKRKSNVRSEEVKVQSDELEIRSNEGISWLFCTTCMKELNPKSPADLGVHITGDRHRKNQEQQGKTGAVTPLEVPAILKSMSPK